MQRDFAAEPAGFWSKLTQGPKQNRQQFEAQTARTAEEAALQKQLTSREQIAEADRLQRAGEVDRRFEDSQRDREARMMLSERELQQRSEQARYLAEQQRLRDEFLAGNELTQIQQRADAQIRAAAAANRDEAAMRFGLQDEEYRWRSKMAADEAARLQSLYGFTGQPGQQTPGRRQLSTNEEEALKKSSSSPDTRAEAALAPIWKEWATGLHNYANPFTVIPLVEYQGVKALHDWMGRSAASPSPTTAAVAAPVEATYTEPSFFGTDRSGALNQERVIAAAKALGMTVEELLKQPDVIGRFLMDSWNPTNWQNPQSRP